MCLNAEKRKKNGLAIHKQSSYTFSILLCLEVYHVFI